MLAHHLTLDPKEDVIGQTARVHIPISWEGNPRVNDLKIVASTPEIKEIVGDETNPLLKARLIYDYLTTRIRYRYTRCYTSVYDVSEYMMACGRGDCGMYALSFITLCCIVGVPVKWESGTTATPGGIGMHDWAMFYIEGICRITQL